MGEYDQRSALRPRIRAGYQPWIFTYNTGAPIAYSAWQLRSAVRSLVERLDPGGRDEALRRIVIVGHSQGGLLAKMTLVETGDAFWRLVSDEPLESFDMSPETFEIVRGSLFPRPLEGVERLVYLATPQHGSYLAAYGPARWLGAMVRTPANIVQAGVDLATSDDEAAAVRRIDDVEGAVGNMSPSSNFIQTLAGIDVLPRVDQHSIIAVRGWGKKIGPDELMEKGSDGVVRYESAHIEGVESEWVVDSDHSLQGHPSVVLELTRILLDHLDVDRRHPGRILAP